MFALHKQVKEKSETLFLTIEAYPRWPVGNEGKSSP